MGPSLTSTYNSVGIQLLIPPTPPPHSLLPHLPRGLVEEPYTSPRPGARHLRSSTLPRALQAHSISFLLHRSHRTRPNGRELFTGQSRWERKPGHLESSIGARRHANPNGPASSNVKWYDRIVMGYVVAVMGTATRLSWVCLEKNRPRLEKKE
jgi:hypothetical protein